MYLIFLMSPFYRKSLALLVQSFSNKLLQDQPYPIECPPLPPKVKDECTGSLKQKCLPSADKHLDHCSFPSLPPDSSILFAHLRYKGMDKDAVPINFSPKSAWYWAFSSLSVAYRMWFDIEF